MSDQRKQEEKNIEGLDSLNGYIDQAEEIFEKGRQKLEAAKSRRAEITAELNKMESSSDDDDSDADYYNSLRAELSNVEAQIASYESMMETLKTRVDAAFNSIEPIQSFFYHMAGHDRLGYSGFGRAASNKNGAGMANRGAGIANQKQAFAEQKQQECVALKQRIQSLRAKINALISGGKGEREREL